MPITPQHMPYQGSSNPIFQEEEELSPVKEKIFSYMNENKKMISLHEQKSPYLMPSRSTLVLD